MMCIFKGISISPDNGTNEAFTLRELKSEYRKGMKLRGVKEWIIA